MAMLPPPTIVIGGGRGSAEALRRVLAGLEAPVGFTVLVKLRDISEDELQALCKDDDLRPFKLCIATDSQEAKVGEICLAPYRTTMTLEPNLSIRLEGGEQHSIDALFRSAATARGARLIGLLLSGDAHDGAQGLSAIKMSGGIRLVQSPVEAVASEAISYAILKDDPNGILLLSKIGPLLTAMMRARET